MSIKLKEAKIDRRDLIRLSSMGAAGLYLFSLDDLAKASVCSPVQNLTISTDPSQFTDLAPVSEPSEIDKRRLFYFIDGCFTNFYLQRPEEIDVNTDGNAINIALVSKVDDQEKILQSTQGYNHTIMTPYEQQQLRILTKARVALHLEFEQTPSNYVEAVVLSDESHRVIGVRNLSPNDYISNGTSRVAPYVIFDRLNLVEGQALHVTYIRRTGNESTIYQYQIPKEHVGPSRFDFQHLPQPAYEQLSAAFIASLVGGTSAMQDTRGTHSLAYAGAISAARPVFPFNGSGGYLTTAYYQHRDTPTHTTRARLNGLDSSGNFEFEIAKMHNDINLGHYMRYFLVLDPVGRIMGGLRRNFTESGTTYDAGLGNSHSSPSYKVKNSMMENAGAADFKLTPYKITEMPYVQLATEDIKDAMAKITFRIR